jgi:ABC-type glycerol-3-phosphate transport system substrate-binding protein
MKNLFKLGFFALALTLATSACNSNKTSEATSDTIDSTAEVKTDSLDAQIDTVDSTADAAKDSVAH